MTARKASGDGWTKVRFVTVDAEKERRRIRRLIAPHLERLIRHREPSWEAIRAIDAATKAPRKARKGKR